MSTFAPLQFLKSAQNPLVWTAIDNGTDTRTSLIIYYGSVNTLPTDTELYEVNCIMMHQAEKQLYANVGTPTTPNWQAFGPGSAFPQPLVPGSFLFTDGATVYWATQLVGQIQYNASNLNPYGILNFNSLLVASNDVPNSRINVDLDVVSLAGDATFISTLEGNLSLQNIGGLLDWTQIDQASVSVDLSTQVTGVLNSTNIDITNLESNLDLANIAGAIDLTTQVTGQLDASNIDVSSLDEQVKVAVDGVTITGDGTTGNPLVSTGGTGLVTLDVFAADGTWNKPVGAKKVLVELWGAGGGGSNGALDTGGGGGGGGAYNSRWYDATELGATEPVVVGVGGTFGVSGGNSEFSSGVTYALAGGGAAGVSSAGGGGGGTAGQGSGTSGGLPTIQGVSRLGNALGGAGGGATSANGNAENGGGAGAVGGTGGSAGNDAGSSLKGGGGGGSGASGGTGTGGTGGTVGRYSVGGGAAGGASGSSGGTAGTAGISFGQAGGGGGGTGNSGTAGVGGAGGVSAGGGGGGGNSPGGNAANGGSGGRGEVRVTTFA